MKLFIICFCCVASKFIKFISSLCFSPRLINWFDFLSRFLFVFSLCRYFRIGFEINLILSTENKMSASSWEFRISQDTKVNVICIRSKYLLINGCRSCKLLGKVLILLAFLTTPPMLKRISFLPMNTIENAKDILISLRIRDEFIPLLLLSLLSIEAVILPIQTAARVFGNSQYTLLCYLSPI